MKVVICGSRNIFLTEEEIDDIVTRSGFNITHLVCGMADGVDRSGLEWANSKGIPVIEKPFISGGKVGGILRNSQMIEIADAWIGVIDGSFTTGTLDCYNKAKKAKLPIHLENLGGL